MCSGLCTINQLFEGMNFKSFAQSQQRFSLPPRDHFCYLRIRQYIQSHANQDKLKTDPFSTEQYYINLCGQPQGYQ